MKYTRALGAVGLAVAAAFVLTTAGPQGSALAQSAQSNQSLDMLANRINQDISSLNADQADYGGHRVKAIHFMQVAHNQLAAAEQFALANGHGAAASNPGASAPQVADNQKRPQGTSDQNIAYMQNDLRSIAAQMNADAYDYGGHKSQAVSALNAADTELNQALQYRHTHIPRA